jgi:hypothetical protein
MPVFQGKATPLSALFQYNLALFGLTCFNPFTEDFTECDMRSFDQLFVMDTFENEGHFKRRGLPLWRLRDAEFHNFFGFDLDGFTVAGLRPMRAARADCRIRVQPPRCSGPNR